MQLDKKAVALALGTISAIISFVCVALIAAIPTQTMSIFGWLIHINRLADIIGQREVTLANAVAGIVVFFVIAYVLGWLFAVLYNRSVQK